MSKSYVLNQRNGLDRIDSLASSVDLAGELSIKALNDTDINSILADCIVIFGVEDLTNEQRARHLQYLLNAYGPTLTCPDFKGRAKETHITYASNKRFLFVGVGKLKDVSMTSFRSSIHVMTQALKQMSSITAIVDFRPHVNVLSFPSEDEMRHELLGFTAVLARIAILSNHSFTRKLNDTSNKSTLKQLYAVNLDVELTSSQIITNESVIANSVILAREIINERGDRATPSELERISQLIVSTHANLSITVLKGQDLIDHGLEMIRAVGRGSTVAEEPRIIMVVYQGDPDSEDKIALVGKGITFDAGGLNIKISHIADMYMDKSGACSVLATVKAMAVIKKRVNVVAVLAIAENLVDSRSTKPHTIINTCKGSVEISDTDCEGRLALADALTIVQRLHKPTVILDVATLTLAAMVAFGENGGAILSNSDSLCEKLTKYSEISGERFWRLPIWPEHHEALQGEYSDFKTFTGTQEDASIAGAFLEKFIEPGVEWAHLDIAGPAMSSKARDWIPAKGTGFSVQLMIDFCLKSAK